MDVICATPGRLNDHIERGNIVSIPYVHIHVDTTYMFIYRMCYIDILTKCGTEKKLTYIIPVDL